MMWPFIPQVFVMDDRPHSGGGGSASRPSGYGGRWGESVPDYEEVQVNNNREFFSSNVER